VKGKFMSDITVEPTLESAEEIHANVSEHYAARARNVGSSCCGPTTSNVSPTPSAEDSCCSPSASGDKCCSSDEVATYTFYDGDDVAGLPEDAVQGSFGCGNPTALASLKPGEVVVDLGSGGGIDVFMAARQVGDEGFVYGIDMTDDMLALARRNAEQMGVTNVEFRKGHIEKMPLEDRTADVIISNCVINLSPDKGQTLTEAFRTLKPGGRLAVSDIVVDGTLDDLPVSESDIRTALSWAGCIAGALTIDQFTTLLSDAGFEKVDIQIKHRYRLEDLGEDISSVNLALTPEVVGELVNRFTSCNIEAYRPV
jgi:arsenite methyltransferase